jgi:hypothetical protein
MRSLRARTAQQDAMATEAPRWLERYVKWLAAGRGAPIVLIAVLGGAALSAAFGAFKLADNTHVCSADTHAL